MFSPDKKVEWQRPLSSIGDRNWDVVVIGAGPAGAIAAVHLAAGGHQVLLLDKDHFPRKKVCGDGLLEDAVRCIDAAGVWESVRRHGHIMHQASIFSPSRIEIKIPGTYITIKRYMLDTLIAQRAVKVGAVFARGKVDRIMIEPDETLSFTAAGITRQFNARIAIVATGANVTILKKTGGFSAPKPTAVAIRCYVRSPSGPDHIVVSCDKGILPGYGWIFPLGNNEFNIGCGGLIGHIVKAPMNIRTIFRTFVDHFPIARKLMRQATVIQPLRGAAIRSDFSGVYPFTKGPLIAVGETIGTTLPVTFEGVGKAMESGELAAEIVRKALVSGDLTILDEYARQLSNNFKPRYKPYRITQKWIARPWLADFVFSRARKSTYFMEGLAGIIAETNNPRDIFSLPGIVKSFCR
jgi:geranylgeranyl reductase family protein